MESIFKITLYSILIIILTSSCSLHKHKKLNRNWFPLIFEVEGRYENLNENDLPEYLLTTAQELEKKYIPSEVTNLNQIFLSEEFCGINDDNTSIIVFFNENFFVSIKIKYKNLSKEKIEYSEESVDFSKRNKLIIVSSFEKIENMGLWNLSVKGDIGSLEQNLTFYLKKDNEYIYHAQFENYYFTLNPTIKIDDTILELVSILESLKSSNND